MKINECRIVTCTLPSPSQKTPTGAELGESIRFPATYYPSNHLTLLSHRNIGHGVPIVECPYKSEFTRLCFLPSKFAFPPCLRTLSYSQNWTGNFIFHISKRKDYINRTFNLKMTKTWSYRPNSAASILNSKNGIRGESSPRSSPRFIESATQRLKGYVLLPTEDASRRGASTSSQSHYGESRVQNGGPSVKGPIFSTRSDKEESDAASDKQPQRPVYTLTHAASDFSMNSFSSLPFRFKQDPDTSGSGTPPTSLRRRSGAGESFSSSGMSGKDDKEKESFKRSFFGWKPDNNRTNTASAKTRQNLPYRPQYGAADLINSGIPWAHRNGSTSKHDIPTSSRCNGREMKDLHSSSNVRPQSAVPNFSGKPTLRAIGEEDEECDGLVYNDDEENGGPSTPPKWRAKVMVNAEIEVEDEAGLSSSSLSALPHNGLSRNAAVNGVESIGSHSPRGSGHAAADQADTAARESNTQKKKARTGSRYKFWATGNQKNISSSSSSTTTIFSNKAGAKKGGVFRKRFSIIGTIKKQKKKWGTTPLDEFERLVRERRRRAKGKDPVCRPNFYSPINSDGIAFLPLGSPIINGSSAPDPNTNASPPPHTSITITFGGVGGRGLKRKKRRGPAIGRNFNLFSRLAKARVSNS